MTNSHSLGVPSRLPLTQRFPRWPRHLLAALAAAVAALLGAVADAEDGLVRLEDTRSGALLLRTSEAGQYLEAPRVRTDVTIAVTGTLARARVTQVFENPSDQWVEGIYVFPLPPDSGVDSLRMQIGSRFIEGEVRERQQAREIYARAAAEGKKAALVEQQRPNVFTNAVANIDPGGTVIVQIEYQHVVRLDGNQLSLRVPLVVAPRYGSAETPEADAVAAPNADPGAGVTRPVTISVTLHAGVPLTGIASAYHTVEVERPDASSAIVTLAGEAPADRDFVLNWTLAPSSLPRAALFREDDGDATYYFGLVLPSTGPSTAKPLPREAVFVIDNSGSMAGESMRQAKAALLFALRSLEPQDRFNVIRFDDHFDVLFAEAVPADARNLATAERFVERLEADGGTEILPALRAALADPTPDDTRLRQVVLLTDGGVSNEDELLAEIGKSLGRSRLFTIGIGSAPNSYLMEHVARLGRGTFTHIGSEVEVGLRVRELFGKLDSPVLTDLVATSDSGLEVWPNPVPDLYAGEPIVLTAVSGARAGQLELHGRAGSKPWHAALDLGSAVPGAGVAKLWARAKIGAIEDWRYRGASQSDIDAEVLKVALQHHLVSRLSSLVAVDVTPSRPQTESLSALPVALALPHGWDFQKFQGGSSRRGAFEGRALLAKLVASGPATGDSARAGAELPRTGLDTDRQLLLGALLLALGAALARLSRPAPRPA